MSSILHVVPGLEAQWSGISVAARLLAKEQCADLVDVRVVDGKTLSPFDEVWVHSTWSWRVWRACWLVLASGKKLVRMTHGNLDPVRLRYHSWKKWLAGPIERYYLRKASRIVAACEAEKGWIEKYLGKRCPPVEGTDIKRFFDLSRVERVGGGDLFNAEEQRGRGAEVGGRECVEGCPINLLYLGRRHPLKGVEYLEAAVREIQTSANSAPLRLCVKIISSAFGEEKEKIWEWCDVLVLPTLSENFGLVIAEALERGKRVITTDGAPAWGDGDDYGGRLTYIRGYKDGSSEDRVRLLKEAIVGLANSER